MIHICCLLPRQIYLVNGSYKGEDSVGKLMHDFGCKEAKDIYYPELAKGVKHFKEEEGGRKALCEAVEKYADRKMLDKQLEMIRNLMDSMKLTAEQAMTALKIPDKEKAVLLKKL